MWAEKYLRLHSLHLFQRATEMGVGKQEEQRGIVGGGEGRKRKKAMYSAFVLIIPPWLEDIQAASVPRLRFGRKGYQQARWGASVTLLPPLTPPPPHRRITFSQKAGKGIGSTGRWGCLVPMYGSVWWATTRRGSRVSGHE